MFNNAYLMGNDYSGGTIGAGLPNLYGSFGALAGGIYESNNYVGSWNDNILFQTGNGEVIVGSKEIKHLSNTIFNASRFNPIYGNSNTVQPPAITINYYIQVYNELINAKTEDAERILTSFKNDAKVELDKFTEDITETYNKFKTDIDTVVKDFNDIQASFFDLCTPDYNAGVSLDLIELQSKEDSYEPEYYDNGNYYNLRYIIKYTVEADGFIIGTIDSDDHYRKLYINDNLISRINIWENFIYLPVHKGDEVKYSLGYLISWDPATYLPKNKLTFFPAKRVTLS